ncbi:MAG TPA: hypothetical protein VGN20_01835 [Mucilaginibacter sp.]
MRILSNLFGLIIFIILLHSVSSYAQTTVQETDSLVNKIHYYGIKQSRSVLFVHFDKNVYVSDENVWFTAYLLGYNKDKNNPSVLSAVLVNDYNKSVALQQEFVMANGLAFGNVFIPDSIPPGNYSFLLYTSVLTNGKPTDTFVQPITIKTASQPAISASLALLDIDKMIPGGDRKIQLNVIAKDDKPIPMALVAYYLGNSTHHLLSGKVKTDQQGQYTFSIPDNQVRAGANEFVADVKYNEEIKHIKLLLPVKENPICVKFYPEGGSLVHATQSTVGLETKDANGVSVSVKGILYKDKHPVDTIKTDRYGVGSFKVIPLMESKYELRLIGEKKDTVYALPKILMKGPVISIQHAVANDTLKLNLVSKYPGKFFLMVHNYKQTFFSLPVQLNAVHKTVAVVLKYVPKGLNTITLLDSMQRPCAERIFFAHYDQRSSININTDSATYHTRQKVRLKLKLNDDGTDTLKGAVSVACIQSNRIEPAKANDIESYIYLRDQLEDIPLKEKYMGQSREDMACLENILLIKGWRRYKWTDMLQTTVSDTIRPKTQIEFTGSVTFNNKLLKKPEDIMLRNDSLIKMLTTENSGRFKLNEDYIKTSTNKGIILMLNGKKEGYKISMNNNFDKVSQTLLNEFKPQNNYEVPVKESNTNAEIIPGFEHSINLRTVTVRGTKDEYIRYSPFFSYGSNACGDYVCYMNVLNCQNHYDNPLNRPPKRGEKYYVLSSTVNMKTMQPTFNMMGYGDDSYSEIIYQECVVQSSNSSALTIRGINYSKEFYGEDYSIVNSSQPEDISTIYWKHLCFVNSKGELNLNFYTSDITGPFKVVVQGITAHDVIYGEKEFNVKKP